MLSLALPPGADPVSRWRSTARAHEHFLDSATVDGDVRPLVLDSWQRSAAFRVDPDRSGPPVVLVDDALETARSGHPLNQVMPVARRLLVDDTAEAGIVVVIGDAEGRILWAEGDRDLCRQAESMHLMAGATWREDAIGTNAIGTALALGETVQVYGSEHFARSVQPWSCTAAPIRDPRSGEVLGFLDITGEPDVVTPHSAFLVRSTIAAMEAELRIIRLRRAASSAMAGKATAGTATAGTASAGAATAGTAQGNRLAVLGRDRGSLSLDSRTIELSLRHTELLLLLTANPDGLSGSELVWQMYEHDAAEVTVRAEMSRLRRIVPSLVSASGRYVLRSEVHTDAADVTDCLSGGRYEQALQLYRGEVLPRSVAPGVVTMRHRLHGWLRNSLLEHGDIETLSRYARTPVGREDAQVWRVCLERLPASSPQHAEAAAILADLDGKLGHSG